MLTREGADLAAILSEPVMTAAGTVVATAAYLQRLREVTTALGIVLIFVPVSTVGGPTELMDLLEPDAHDGQAPMGVMSTFGGNQVGMAAGIACLEKLTPEVHARVSALGDRTRARIDDIARRYGIPLHATGLGHLIGIHWAEERVVDYRTRLLDDREKVININLALDNDG